MADLTSLGTAALAVIADGDVHWVAEAIVALDALLQHSGGYLVALAVVYSFHKIGTQVVQRWQPTPKRRAADAPSVIVNTAPPAAKPVVLPPPRTSAPPPAPTTAPPTSAAPPQ